VRERLIYTLASAGVPVDKVIGEGPGCTVTYLPGSTQQQQDAGAAILAAFDWSAAAQAAWLTARQRERAGILLGLADAEYKLLRAVAGVLVDEINTLRQNLPQIVRSVTTAWDPASLASGGELASPNVTAAGAVVGDGVEVLAPYSLQGLFAWGNVTAPDTVVVRLRNGTAGAVNLAAGNWTVVVYRYGGLADRTLAQARAATLAKLASGDVDS
jgi:hypothetical protein